MDHHVTVKLPDGRIVNLHGNPIDPSKPPPPPAPIVVDYTPATPRTVRIMPVMDTDTTSPAAEPEPIDPDEVEQLAQAIDWEENGRKWLRAIAPIITAAYGTDAHYDRRAQYALDSLVIAACERAGRILRSDLGPE